MFAETGDINWIEFLWTLEGVLGVILSCYCIQDAIKDLAAIEFAKINHGMEIVAKSNLYTELARLGKQSLVAFVGIYAMTLSPSPYPHTPLGWIVVLSFVMIPFLVGFNTVNSIITRHKLMGVR